MPCCGNCFNDRFLKEFIKTEPSKINTDCTFCGLKNVPCIPAEKLSAHFLNVIDNQYIETNENKGKPAWVLLNEDWLLFKNLDEKSSALLFIEMFPDENIADKKYIPRIIPSLDKIEKWEEFKKELKHENRYFYKKSPSRDEIEILFKYLILNKDETPKIFFRARICDDGTPFSMDKMGKPPLGIVRGGRANPIGISYLYTASNPDTAIAEVKPYVGDYVCIAQFDVNDELEKNTNLVLMDLRHPRETISPFLIEENDFDNVLNNIDYMRILGDELSKPIIPKKADLEYLSTQYLCELIKHFNYDGVVYKSSIASGDNYAIFNDDKLLIKKIFVHKITSSEYKSILVK
jgi:hypothetical protein